MKSTRRDILKAGAGLAGILAAGKAPAVLIGLRNSMTSKISKYWGLYFEAADPGVVINMHSGGGKPPSVTLEYSLDGVAWTPFDADNETTPITLVNKGDIVFFKAGAGGNSRMNSGTNTIRYFTSSGAVYCGGNIMSLLDGSNPNLTTITEDYCFSSLFISNHGLLTPPQFPATTLAPYCYNEIFEDCLNLTESPVLPAIDVPEGAYEYMFMCDMAITHANPILATTVHEQSCYGMFECCEALEYPPEMAITNLAGMSCLSEMFAGCLSLKEIANIPAVNLSHSCYEYMFMDCTSLEKVHIPNVVMSDYSLSSMFDSCTQLNDITVDFSSWGRTSICTAGWVDNVAKVGIFRCPKALGVQEMISRGVSYCPQNWTVVNTD